VGGKFAAVLSASLLAVLPAFAGDDLDVVGTGGQLYRTYCASCHGVEGRGNGPAAAALATPPADLTALAQKFGRPLPVDRLAEFIDGRKEITAHGTREMPVWGETFFDESGPGNPAVEKAKRGAILMIIRYLDSIQTTQQAKG
jgi:mono/diheme cytochrome c family protein